MISSLPRAFFLFFLLSPAVFFAQERFTVSGIVKDARNGELMIGASILVKDQPSLGTVSNDYGFFSLTLPSGRYVITISSLGYQSQDQSVVLDKNRTLSAALTEASTSIQEVVVQGEKANRNIVGTETSVNRLEVKDLKNIPVLFGEKDILKTIQLLPGVKSAGEGNAGFYVRGGGIDQNLILLDEATVYNASHLLGFFSVFNSDAIKEVNLIKGGMPAQYGGRLSSVLDIKMNDGNNQNYTATGGLGLISSRLTVEGPIEKDKSSFVVSGRRTYADLFLKLSKDSAINKNTLYFYDLNAKANYTLNDKNRFYLSGYFGRDVLGFGTAFGIDWGNTTATLRWNHVFNNQFFSNTSLIYNDYKYNINISQTGIALNIHSAIRDYNLKEDMEYYLHNQTLRFGVNSVYHNFVPGTVSRVTDSITKDTSLLRKYGWENAVYFSDEFSISKRLKANIGLRYSIFSLLGGGEFYTYNKDGSVLDSAFYGAGNIVKTYSGFEPRLALNYVIDAADAVKFSYARTRQYIFLLSNTTSTSPTDLWVPVSNNIKPQQADQYDIGYYKNLKDNIYEASVEIYYKTLDNQIDYRNGAQLRFNQNVESELIYGSGKSYGVEFFVKKRKGRLNGWVGYTLSRTERQFDEVNGGKPFPARQDETHDLSIVGIYDLSKKWNFSATFVYNTGNAVTFPSGRYLIDNHAVGYYTERNGYRLPPYHRLDIGFNYTAMKTAKRESTWNFSVYNAYNHKNAYTITFRPNPDNPIQTQAVETSLFGIIPSVTWNFKF